MVRSETIAIRPNLMSAMNCLILLKRMGADAKLESVGSNFVIKVPESEVDKFKHLFKGGAYR